MLASGSHCQCAHTPRCASPGVRESLRAQLRPRAPAGAPLAASAQRPSKASPSVEVELLRELLSVKDAVVHAKDEALHAKDEALHAKDETLRKSEEAAHFQLQLERAAMRAVMSETARTVEGVKLRAMVEYLAKTHGASQGAQTGLSALFASEAQLRAVVDAFSTEFKLLQVDLERNVSGLYHSLSKELHGSESRIEVQEAHWRSSPERAVLCALLERFCVTYVYVNVDGQVVPSPYTAVAKRVLEGNLKSSPGP